MKEHSRVDDHSFSAEWKERNESVQSDLFIILHTKSFLLSAAAWWINVHIPTSWASSSFMILILLTCVLVQIFCAAKFNVPK